MPFTLEAAPEIARVALVTGGAKRIGRVLCETLAQMGFAIAVHYHNSQREAQALCDTLTAQGYRAQGFAADLSDPQATTALMQQVAAQLGAVGVLVNNASLFAYDALHTDTPLDADLAQEHWRINTLAPLLLTQALFHQLPTTAQGVVVNLLDQKLFNPNPDFVSYTLSKAALAEATRLAAMALAPRVRVVGIAPGLTLPSYAHDATQFAALHQLSPLGRSSTPHDLAQTLVANFVPF